MKSVAFAVIGIALPLALPAHAEAPPLKAEPAKAEPVKTETVKAEPAKGAPAKVDASAAPAGAAKAETPKVACPPGAFCQPAEPTPPPAPPVTAAPQPPALEPGTLTVHVPPPPPGADPKKPRTVVIQPAVDGRPPQVTVYEDGDAPPTASPVALPPAPPPPPPYDGPRHHEFQPAHHTSWGLALRAVGGLMGSPRVGVENFGIGGIGLSLRSRPLLPVAFDLGVDLVGGVDPNGWSRREVPIAASTLLYLNPRSVAQVYVLGGVNLTFAGVQSRFIEPNFAGGTYDDYTYLGMQLGGGVEFRLSRVLGFHFDGLASIRTRVDSDGHGRFPEYYDVRTGLASNSSTVGQLRAGLSLWW